MSPFLVASGLLAFLTISATLDPTLDTAWEDWKGLHGKGYLEGEEASRRAVWEDNWRMIEQHNWEACQGKHTYRLGMNHFGDLTNEEFRQMMDCFVPLEGEPATGNVSGFHGSANVKLPRNVDWRKKHMVTRVKNQGACGSCWAFSATGALEALHAKQTRQLVPLSEQELVDCSQNNGCQGGYHTRAFVYVKRNRGLSAEKSYPYRAQRGECWANSKIGIRIRRIVEVPRGNERYLEKAVATVGPVSVGLRFRSKEFQFYKSGVFSDTPGGVIMGHAVLVVGYRTDNYGRSQWILKNSYSERWGDKGYFYLPKGFNVQGIANAASFPV